MFLPAIRAEIQVSSNRRPPPIAEALLSISSPGESLNKMFKGGYASSIV